MSNREKPKTEVLRGTLDLMVLQALVSLGPAHGYAIASRMEDVSEGALLLNIGTLYPGPMRLEHRGLISMVIWSVRSGFTTSDRSWNSSSSSGMSLKSMLRSFTAAGCSGVRGTSRRASTRRS